MTAIDLNPSRIEFRRDGYTIWVDEDGVHIKTSARGFEMPEAIAMVELYQAALGHFHTGAPWPKPTPPPHTQYQPDEYTVHRVKRAFNAAIETEYGVTL